MVWTTVNYTLAAGSEVETLRSNRTTGLTLTGNEFANTIMGSTSLAKSTTRCSVAPATTR